MSASHQFLKVARQIHLYLGVFIAPTLLFFALTGGLQVFSLHETTRGSSYKPPAWLVTLAQVHKKQTTVLPQHKPKPAEAEDHRPAPAPASSAVLANPVATVTPAPNQGGDAPHAPAKNPLPLKIFFAFVALGLFISTLIGIYMSFRYTRKVKLVSAVLLAGVIVPIVLAMM